ncbi:hypothetical protein D3C87_1874740 [compost metagenome]
MSRAPDPEAKFNVPVISRLFTVTIPLRFMIMVLPATIFTLSVLKGTIPPVQLEGAFQFPPLEVELTTAGFA